MTKHEQWSIDHDTTDEKPCPHCGAGVPSVWDSVLFHYAHVGEKPGALRMCWHPWRERETGGAK